MVINDLDIPGVLVAPDKADAPLVVDADAVLPFPVAFQRFKAVAGRGTKIVENCRRIDR